MTEVRYECQKCGSKEMSTYNISVSEKEKTAFFYCYCPECGHENKVPNLMTIK